MFAFKGRERRREEGVGETKSHRLKEGGGGGFGGRARPETRETKRHG